MTSRRKLPISEEKVFERAREMLRASAARPERVPLNPDAPLRIRECYALRRASDGHIFAYSVHVLVDPKLGVRVDDPTRKPLWGSERVLSIMFDENGERPIPEELDSAEAERTT